MMIINVDTIVRKSNKPFGFNLAECLSWKKITEQLDLIVIKNLNIYKKYRKGGKF